MWALSGCFYLNHNVFMHYFGKCAPIGNQVSEKGVLNIMFEQMCCFVPADMWAVSDVSCSC